MTFGHRQWQWQWQWQWQYIQICIYIQTLKVTPNKRLPKAIFFRRERKHRCSSTTEHPHLPTLLACAPSLPPLSLLGFFYFLPLFIFPQTLEEEEAIAVTSNSSCWEGFLGEETRDRVFERCGMLGALMNLLSLCWKPFYRSDGRGADFNRDGLLWYRDIGRYTSGEFSMAVVQANQVLEDQSQIESGPFGTFVGVYDGHGGPEAARYVCDHLFRHFQAMSAEDGGVVTAGTIERAFLETERGFTALVSELWNTQPHLATIGSCCLTGVIHERTLFVANLGDSRVVLGKKVGNTEGIAAIQLSTEHNANIEAIRHELKELHPNDPQIVVLKHGVWRVKGIIQVSRSIGDVYMKHSQYNREPINGKFRLSEPMNMPILSATPSILSHPLHPNDSFLIFASDGLWEHLSNERAVEIVHIHPHAGSAKRLVKAALQEAARKREMRYSDLRKIDKKVRRHFHDDISVIVLFLNHDLISRSMLQDPPLSLRSALEH